MTGLFSCFYVLPADKVDDSFVCEGGICWAGISSFICELHHVILVWEFPAHLTAAHCSAGILNTHSYNAIHKQKDYSLTQTPICMILNTVGLFQV